MTNVLVIDDDYYLRTLMRIVLENAGHKVIEAANGIDGERASFSNNVDIIFTDIFMPNQDGLQTIINIRKTNSAVIIVAMSSGDKLHTLDYLRYSRIFGAMHSMQKPLSVAVILAIAEKASPGPGFYTGDKLSIGTGFRKRPADFWKGAQSRHKSPENPHA